jgi:hypothetical protein
LQDGANIEDFKYLSKGKVFPVPTLFLSPFARGRATSKHGGGRYDAILEFKGSKYKNNEKRKKMRKRKKEK